MNLEELRSAQDAERKRSDLQPLRESFYEEAGEYIASLKEQRDEVAADADDPFSSPEVRRLTDEIETAEEVVEAIYDRRLGKLVERASLAASEMTVDDDGLTAEEQALFEDLVARMEASKHTVQATLDPEQDVPSGDPEPDDGDGGGGGDGVSAADLMGGDTGPSSHDASTADTGGEAPGRDTTEPPDPARDTADSAADADATGDAGPDRLDSTPSPDAGSGPGPTPGETTAGAGGVDGDVTSQGGDRVTVRITRDVGQILGVDDRQYDLAAEDVVQLPATNADPLVERGAAERLD